MLCSLESRVISVFHNKSKTYNFSTIKTSPSGRHTVIIVGSGARSELGGNYN
jgi:hypothetical protein